MDKASVVVVVTVIAMTRRNETRVFPSCRRLCRCHGLTASVATTKEVEAVLVPVNVSVAVIVGVSIVVLVVEVVAEGFVAMAVTTIVSASSLVSPSFLLFWILLFFSFSPSFCCSQVRSFVRSYVCSF